MEADHKMADELISFGNERDLFSTRRFVAVANKHAGHGSRVQVLEIRLLYPPPLYPADSLSSYL